MGFTLQAGSSAFWLGDRVELLISLLLHQVSYISSSRQVAQTWICGCACAISEVPCKSAAEIPSPAGRAHFTRPETSAVRRGLLAVLILDVSVA